MSVVLIMVLLGAIALGAAGVVFLRALARRSGDRFAAQNEVLPGVASDAPAAWAGAHSPEAKMHRRLGKSVRALRVQSELQREDVGALELRVELEQHALAVDRRLIAAAAMPEGVREQALAEVEVSVEAVVQAAAELSRAMGQTSTTADVMGLEDLAARIKGMTAEG